MFLKILIVNILTFIRVIGSFVLVPIYNIYGGFYVGIIAMFGYLTDSIDGILARKWHASTFFGALLDGVADKLFTIVNFIVLFLITPYALIPIIFEILIIIVQLIKYHKKLNIKSNMIGKSKVWVLAICVVLTFLISDISSFNSLTFNIFSGIQSISVNKLYFWLLFPASLMEALTLLSYIMEMITPSNLAILKNEQEEIDNNMVVENKEANFKEVWLNPDYYTKHKNDNNLRKVTKVSKKK